MEDRIQNLVDEVSLDSYQAYLTHLTSYPTRFSTSTHYFDAAQWCQDQLAAQGYSTAVDNIAVGNEASVNIIADRTGSGSGTRDLVMLVAHLDSVNINGAANAPAPGADDNASGSAALLEIARVLSIRQFVHDIRLVLFGGEEQGLHGSSQYVASLTSGDRTRIRFVLNMDMIGTLNTPVPTVLLEGAAVSQSVIDDLANAAATYTSLTVETSLNPFNSDHVSFINAGLPAVLTIEGADSANTNVHTANDGPAHIDYSLALEILKMNLAAVATRLRPNPQLNGLSLC